MPFDPNFPNAHTLADSALMRAQLQAIVGLIESVPVGPPGPAGNDGAPGANGNDGAQGPAFASAVVDGVTTLAPGDPATVSSFLDGTAVHLSFGIPRGTDGLTGAPGAEGPAGPAGPAFATAVVDGVTTLGPGEPATVSASLLGSTVHFTFGIPTGATGETGAPGDPGAAGAEGPIGPQGDPGLPGDVTAGQLASAVATTSANSNAVNDLALLAISDPPTQVEVEQLRQKLNELISGPRRV